MLSHESKIRVRYGESDKMGYVYYGNYPLYYEVGRTEMLRAYGLSYREMEDNGILLPVISLECHYVNPAFYDDLLTIKTYMKEIPSIKIHFDYEIFNELGEKINYGETSLVFINTQTRKPCRPPQNFLDLIKPHFSK